MWEELLSERKPQFTQENPHGRETLQMPGVRKELQSELAPLWPRETPPRGDNLGMPTVREELRREEPTSAPPTDPHGREAFEGLGRTPNLASSNMMQPVPDLHGINPVFLSSNPSRWSVEEVYEFIASLQGCQDIAEEFRSQEIDGQALLLLKEEHLMSAMNIKLGPALKICAKINILKDT